MSDLDLDRSYRRGNRGAKVRLIQQAQKKLADDGVVDDLTFEALTKPMRAALAPVRPRRAAKISS
jgi:hypothetical protein